MISTTRLAPIWSSVSTELFGRIATSLAAAYALLGLNFGYNTRAYYGWNNFQFDIKDTWEINRIVSIFGGINYSVAMTALRKIDQGNEVWASAGLTFTF